MQVKIARITKDIKKNTVSVFVSYPGALNEAEFVFKETAPSEIGLEFYSKASKSTMEQMRGGNWKDR